MLITLRNLQDLDWVGCSVRDFAPMFFTFPSAPIHTVERMMPMVFCRLTLLNEIAAF